MWAFDLVREYAIKQIDERFTDPFDRLDLVAKCNVEKWRAYAYRVICERQEPLTQLEGSRLGMARLIAIGRIREQRPRVGAPTSSEAYCPNCGGYHAMYCDISMASREVETAISQAVELQS